MTQTGTPRLPDNVTSTMLPVVGGEIHVFEAGSGTPVLFLHPSGGAGMWLPFHEGLSHGYRVIAPDHPGFGQSPELEWAQGIDDLVYLYLDVIERLKLSKPIVIGSSFGGWIAAELAVVAPEKIDKLVLIDPIRLRLPVAPIVA